MAGRRSRRITEATVNAKRAIGGIGQPFTVTLPQPSEENLNGSDIAWLPDSAVTAGRLSVPPRADESGDLYWARIGERTGVARTPWPIARALGDIRPDPIAVADMVHSPLLPSDPDISCLSGVSRLSAHQRRLDQVIGNAPGRGLTPRRLLSELDERLRCAVRSTLPQDGRVAVLSTGGLDSSVVAAMVREVLGVSPVLIAVRGGLSSPTECHLQKELARALGSKLLTLDELPGFSLRPLIQLNRDSDFPVGGVFSHIWDAALDLAQECGAKVVLTGEGGNELFSTGLATAADQLRAGRLVAALTTVGRSRPSNGTSVTRSIRRGFRSGMFPDLREEGSRGYVIRWQGRYAACAPQAHLRRREQIRQLRERRLSHAAIAAHLWLERTDLYAARSSRGEIIVKSPLAEDAQLWSYLASAPANLLANTATGQDKQLLRLIGRRYLPAAITETRKVGVANQIAILLRTVDRGELQQIRAGADWLGLSLDSAYERPADLPADCGLAWTRTLAMSAWGLNALS